MNAFWTGRCLKHPYPVHVLKSRETDFSEYVLFKSVVYQLCCPHPKLESFYINTSPVMSQSVPQQDTEHHVCLLCHGHQWSQARVPHSAHLKSNKCGGLSGRLFNIQSEPNQYAEHNDLLWSYKRPKDTAFLIFSTSLLNSIKFRMSITSLYALKSVHDFKAAHPSSKSASGRNESLILQQNMRGCSWEKTSIL